MESMEPTLFTILLMREAEPWLWWFLLTQHCPDTQFASLQHKEACQVHREIQVQAVIQSSGPCLHHHQPEPSPCVHGQWRAGSQLHCLQSSEYQLYIHAWHIWVPPSVILEGTQLMVLWWEWFVGAVFCCLLQLSWRQRMCLSVVVWLVWWVSFLERSCVWVGDTFLRGCLMRWVGGCLVHRVSVGVWFR